MLDLRIDVYSLAWQHRSSRNIPRPIVALRLEAVDVSGVRWTIELDLSPIYNNTMVYLVTYRAETFTASNLDADSSNVAVRGVSTPQFTVL